MRKLPPQAALQRIFHYKEGALFWGMNRDALNVTKGDPVEIRLDPDGYQVTRVFDRRVPIHRIIFKMHHDIDPEQVDHIDRDKGNNTISNLRAATHQMNQANRAGWSEGYKGVYPSGPNYRAMISIDGKPTHIGTYATDEEAARAYDEQATLLFGEFAYRNFPHATKRNSKDTI